MRSFLPFLLAFTWSISLFSQNRSTGLNVGDPCPSIIVNTSDNSIQSFVFPNAGKLTMLHFWSSSNPESIREFYRFSLINKKYASEDYKSANGFDMILVALQSDRIAWQADLTKYNLLDAKNGICLKGLDDFYVKNFKLSATPATLIIDEQGKIIAVNPDADAIVRLLNDKRDYTGEDKPVSKISGQILVGKGSIAPLTNETIYVINSRKDTVQTTSTNGSGKFTLSNESMEGITLNIHKSAKIAETDDVLLANERGTVVAGFTKGSNEFEYRLLDLELSFLKPIVEPEVKMKSFIKDLYFSENLYEDGGYTLSQKSKARLDALLVKLKDYPGATVEIISHSDCRGSSESNQALSLKRSESVAHYFISKGIPNNKIKSIGRGEEEPLNHCVDGVPCTEKELAVNRRTEFRFYASE
eukprot:TRINITY_DN82825_c0_g1_i1.p1 TRINITY_DN82825_c0_g1~~TRINITY_DN82825_c0_g1_i1.p1  ORF type:complete len:415 (-),score=65.19 TRINITY_DN82825_c0_g1_i1:324-1568(-)